MGSLKLLNRDDLLYFVQFLAYDLYNFLVLQKVQKINKSSLINILLHKVVSGKKQTDATYTVP